MRIQEERERRERQARNLERLPGALQELHGFIVECVHDYNASFGADSAKVVLQPDRITVTVREQRNGKWQELSKVEVVIVPDMPGFQVERGDSSLAVEVGLLPSDKLFYRDRAEDIYLTMDEFTRRILDRALFPALREQ